MTAFGALDYGSGVVVSHMAPTGNATHFRAFLDQLDAHWPEDQLVLVLDNASYHKTPAVRAWFAAHAARVSVLWLPTYSPHLNLIERVWRFVNGKLACHRLWNDVAQLTATAKDVLARTRATFAAPAHPHLTLGQDLCVSA